MLSLIAQVPIDPSQIVEAVNKGPLYIMACCLVGLVSFLWWMVKRFDAKEEKSSARYDKASQQFVGSMETISKDHREFGRVVTEKLTALTTSVDNLGTNVNGRLDRVETRVGHVEDVVAKK